MDFIFGGNRRSKATLTWFGSVEPFIPAGLKKGYDYDLAFKSTTLSAVKVLSFRGMEAFSKEFGKWKFCGNETDWVDLTVYGDLSIFIFFHNNLATDDEAVKTKNQNGGFNKVYAGYYSRDERKWELFDEDDRRVSENEISNFSQLLQRQQQRGN